MTMSAIGCGAKTFWACAECCAVTGILGGARPQEGGLEGLQGGVGIGRTGGEPRGQILSLLASL